MNKLARVLINIVYSTNSTPLTTYLVLRSLPRPYACFQEMVKKKELQPLQKGQKSLGGGGGGGHSQWLFVNPKPLQP